jgi:hypothetical protein
MSSMNQVVHQLHAQRRRAAQELEKLDLAIKALASRDGRGATLKAGFRRKPKFSAAARARIAAAQRARWAKIRAAQKK